MSDATDKNLTDDIAKLEAETQDEIAAIMNDIENLQKSMSEVTQTAPEEEVTDPVIEAEAPRTHAPGPATAPSGATSFGPLDDPETDTFPNQTGESSLLEETLATIKDESTGGTLLDEVLGETESDTVADSDTDTAPRSNPMTAKKTLPAGEGTLSMTLTGSMTLKLKYDFDGQEVTVSFDSDCLKVEMADGTEFKIPVAKRPSLKAVS